MIAEYGQRKGATVNFTQTSVLRAVNDHPHVAPTSDNFGSPRRVQENATLLNAEEPTTTAAGIAAQHNVTDVR